MDVQDTSSKCNLENILKLISSYIRFLVVLQNGFVYFVLHIRIICIY